MVLTLELSSCKNGAAQLALQVETLSEQQSKKQEEIEDIQCHATANYNALLVRSLPYNSNNNFIYTLESKVKLRSVVFTITGCDGIQ